MYQRCCWWRSRNRHVEGQTKSIPAAVLVERATGKCDIAHFANLGSYDGAVVAVVGQLDVSSFLGNEEGIGPFGLPAVLYRLYLYLIEGAFLESAQGVGSVGNTINGSPQTRGTSFADIFNRHIHAVGLLVLVIGNGECIVLSSLEDEVVLPPEDVVFKVTVTCRNKTPVVKLRSCESLFDRFW